MGNQNNLKELSESIIQDQLGWQLGQELSRCLSRLLAVSVEGEQFGHSIFDAAYRRAWHRQRNQAPASW